MIAKGSLDEALNLLGSIPADYPNYPKAIALISQINDKKQQAASAQQAPVQAQKPAPAPITKPAPKPTPPAFSTPITIKGDDACRTDTLKALQAIASFAPGHYSIVTRYISIIECVPSGSAMYAYETPPRYAVGDATRNAGAIWYAGTIVHDANHSRLYHEGKEWTGGNAENICLDAQANALAQMGAGQSTIDYVNGMKGDPYWKTPVEDRYW